MTHSFPTRRSSGLLRIGPERLQSHSSHQRAFAVRGWNECRHGGETTTPDFPVRNSGACAIMKREYKEQETDHTRMEQSSEPVYINFSSGSEEIGRAHV